MLNIFHFFALESIDALFRNKIIVVPLAGGLKKFKFHLELTWYMLFSVFTSSVRIEHWTS